MRHNNDVVAGGGVVAPGGVSWVGCSGAGRGGVVVVENCYTQYVCIVMLYMYVRTHVYVIIDFFVFVVCSVFPFVILLLLHHEQHFVARGTLT